uniref:Reverse transcriptase domain-containing protein n=1 Tax=Tanacetum cinerariifolium TaxID=118510 RepID=A0A6L2LS39_TANCI|nr:reverse transcriptase domain-containing protein [Tanacetum cinerariifolium]
MRTRFNFYPFNSTATIPRRSNRRRVPNIVEPEIHTIEEIILMADRTMEELLQEPTEGDVSNDAIKLMLFSYSLVGAAKIWDNVSKTDDRIDKLTDQISNLVEIVNKQVIAPAKAIEKTCVTCEGAHAYYDCIAIDNNQHSVCAATGSSNQVSPPNRASHQIPPPGFAPINLLRGNFNKQEENLRRNLNEDMRSILGIFFQNQPSTLGTLPSNIVPNPKGEMKVVTTRSGLAYEGPSIPTNSPLEKVDGKNIEGIMDKEHSNCPRSTGQVQPPVVPILIPELDVPRTQSKPTIPYPSRDGKLTPTRMTLELADRSITHPKGVAKDVFVKVGKFHFPTYFVVIDFEADPRVPLILGRSFLRTGQFIQDNTKNSNPTLVSENDVYKEPILKSSSPSLTPFRESDFFLEIEDFLNYDSILTRFDNSLYDNYLYDPKGDILYLENFLNEDPFQLHLMNLKQAKFPIEEPKYSLSMGYKHLSTTPETESDEVTESSVKNLVPILSEYEITSDDESEYEVPVKDNSSPAFTTFSNPLFDCNDDFTSSDNESILDEDFDYLEEFSDALMPTSIADEERIRREHAEYISLMERLFTIYLFPRSIDNANTIVESLPSSPIPVQDSDSEREEIDIVTGMDELLPLSIESDDYDSEGDINVLEELLVDDSISLPENKSFYFDHQDDLSFPVLLQNHRMLSLILSPIQEK